MVSWLMLLYYYAGSNISIACRPPSLYKEYMTSTQTSMAGKDIEAAQKLDGLIQSSTTSILLASTPAMLPRWCLTDPSGRPLLADCQRSNLRKALKSITQVYIFMTVQYNILLFDPPIFASPVWLDHNITSIFLRS